MVVYNVTRFSRNAHNHAVVRALLYRLGISLRSVNEPISEDSVGKLTENMLAAIAQFDNDQKSERTKAGMRAALQRGRWTWTAPLGYRQGNTRLGEPSLIPDDSATLVIKAFELMASGDYRTADVLRLVTTLGLRTRSDSPLTAQTFGTLLKNRIYVGYVNSRGLSVVDVRGDFQPLISEELFARVQLALKQGNKAPAKYISDSPAFPLRRFVSCGSCGLPLTGSSPKGRSKSYAYYHCRKCKTTACCGGFKYRAITSAAFSSKCGSSESM